MNEKRVPELYTDASGSQYLMPTAQGGQVTPLEEATSSTSSGNGDVVAELRSLRTMLAAVLTDRPNVSIDKLITLDADRQSGYQESLRKAEELTYGSSR